MFLYFLSSPKSFPDVGKLTLIWNYLDNMTASSALQHSATAPRLKPGLAIIAAEIIHQANQQSPDTACAPALRRLGTSRTCADGKLSAQWFFLKLLDVGL